MLPHQLLMAEIPVGMQNLAPTNYLTTLTFTASNNADPTHLFDNDDTTPAADPVGYNANTAIAYDYGVAVTPQEVRFKNANSFGLASAASMKIQYSDVSLSSGWTDSGQAISLPAGTSTVTTQAISAGSHRYWRLFYQSGTQSGNFWVGEVTFRG